MIFKSYNDIGLEEILSEYRRARLMIIALVVLLIIAVANFLFLSDSITIMPGGKIIFRVVMVWLSALTLFECLVFIRVHWFHRRRLRLPFAFRLITSLIEISYPGVLLWFFVVKHGNLVFLDSPLLPIYFLIIILSTLHLKPTISILVGLAAAFEYGWIIFEGFRQAPVSALPLLPQPAYYSRCVMLLLSGLASGFVADQIRKRVNAFIRINEQKRKVELSFGQQVSPEIADALTEQGDQARKMEATILVLDIRNFTDFASSHSPAEILAYQNKIFSPILNIIRKHHGIVHQILGDGIMALFGVPVSTDDHASRALLAAIEIRAMLTEQNRVAGGIPCRIGIGLDTGQVITGNIGNEERKQYSISGTPVIIAFRVEQLNKELQSDILVTRALRDNVPDHLMESVDRGFYPLKGFHEPVKVYQVIRLNTLPEIIKPAEISE